MRPSFMGCSGQWPVASGQNRTRTTVGSGGLILTTGHQPLTSMFLGIEIGGTKLQLGLGRGDGQLLGLWRGNVIAAAGGEGIRQEIVRAIPELLTAAGMERGQLRGIGVGFGGPTDDATQSVVK